MRSLDTYRAKRNFEKTSEPAGAADAQPTAFIGGSFVIHKHAARRLHYDLRLEYDGVLWSWAVTKGPSLDPAEKRLAVHVEDHPLAYRSFEGNIPKGQYGGGSVIVWDDGQWHPEADPAAGLEKGHLSFTLEGHKLRGGWHLVRLKPRSGEKRDNWLLMKAADAQARTDSDILETEPHSVISGRTVEDVSAGKNAPVQKSIGKRLKPPVTGDSTSAAIAPLPGFIAPCLATLATVPPSGAQWLHEVKFDGYRLQVHIQHGAVRMLTRTGLDWTAQFGASLRSAFEKLHCQNAILDSEIVVLTDKGISSFAALQAALTQARVDDLVCFIFDLLFLDGQDLRGEPLLARKQRLAGLLGPQTGDSILRYSEDFMESGETMLRHACRMGLEGVVSKRVDAPYRSGRGAAWVKSKCKQRQEFVILGYVPSKTLARGLGSLVVGYREGNGFKPAGRVGTGFTAKAADALKKRLDPHMQSSSALSGVAAQEKGIVWVAPELVAEVEFGGWTADGSLRHASFQGLREDKPAMEVVAEAPIAAEDLPTAMSVPRSPRISGAETGEPVTSVKITHGDKLLWSDAGLSKQGLLDYYARVWKLMAPFVINRPLSLLRAPDGIAGQTFFQKHAAPGMHAAIAKMTDPKDGEDLLFIRDFDGLAALVQLGTVEIHIWGCKIDAIELPDQIVFDLDPDPQVALADVRAAALTIKEHLQDLGLRSFVKLSGGKGYHIVAPLKPQADWGFVKTFARDFAQAMAQAEPQRFTATLSKQARTGKIFIDYLRNGRGSTTVAPYSTRARATAPVSLPVSWEKLQRGANPDEVTVAIIPAELGTRPWADFWNAAKVLRPARDSTPAS